MECILGKVGHCKAAGEDFQGSVTDDRFQAILSASRQRQDGLHEQLLEVRHSGDVVKIHRKCVSLYSSKTLIARVTKRHRQEEIDVARSSKQLRSDDLVSKTGVQFNFKMHCLFCINVTPCVLPSEYSRKVPHARRIPAYSVCTDINQHGKEYTKVLLAKCSERNDKLGEVVRFRIMSLGGDDLPAADARYHAHCKPNFMYNFAKGGKIPDDPAFLELVHTMSTDRSKLWNSTELQQEYEHLGGTKIKQKKDLVENIKAYYNDAVIILSSPGMANIVSFTSETTKMLHLLKQDEDDDLDAAVVKVARQIQKEAKSYKQKRTTYTVNIDRDIAREPVSETLLTLLEKVSSNFHDSLSSILIGNIISSTVNTGPTDLQIALGVAMRRNKSLIHLLHEYNVCCSYDEVLLFKYSAAMAVANSVESMKFEANSSIIHCCADNFDCEISSQNCQKMCHSLAMILAQTEKSVKSGRHANERKTVLRQKMDDRYKPVNFEIPEVIYDGPKKPPMPSHIALKQIPSLSFLCSQILSVRRASKLDFTFMKDIVSLDECPEWSGYNTRQARAVGMTVKPEARVMYFPLINKVPSSPSTILTAIEKGLTLVGKAGQTVLVFTVDQQLYKVTIDLLFNSPSYFTNVIPLLGGMHMLMAFIHATCIILSLPLRAILSSTFGSVDKMMSGKKYPQNFRAIRMIAEEMLRHLLQNNPEIMSMDDLISCLNDRSTQSKTTKLWTDNLIKTVFIMTAFVRGAHEQDLPLQISAAESMLPYFAAAGCHNYTRYGSFYVHHMLSQPPEFLKKMNTDCSLRLIPGLSNAIFTDQFIETTYMRLGHGPGGATGLVTDDRQMTIWALSFATSGQLINSLEKMTEKETPKATHHKEESVKRIEADRKDRESIQRSLSLAIDPLKPDQHPEGKLLNIVTGEEAHPDVNAHDALNIGKKIVKDFRRSWPTGFYNKISKGVITFDFKKKHVVLGEKKVYDQDMIYARIIGLMSSCRDIGIDSCLKTELSAYPPSMFDSAGLMRVAKKSTLKTSLQVTHSDRSALHADTIIVDVSALLWTIKWPVGKLQLYINAVKEYAMQALMVSNTVFVFDRYFKDSTKAYLRQLRQEKQGMSRVHVLRPDMPAPPKESILGVTKNKIQLNKMVAEALMDPEFYIKATEKGHSLTIAGVEDVPIEIMNGVKTERRDLTSSHEEADPIIAQHAIARCHSHECIRVISDDTDVFALLLYFYVSQRCTSAMYMSSPQVGREVVDIKATAEKHPFASKFILQLHALTGSDTVAATYGIGKKRALKALQIVNPECLSVVGDTTAELQKVCASATAFLCACFGKTYYASCKSMTECRTKMWKKKIGSGTTIKLCTIPPTSEAVFENIMRAHYQVAHWREALSGVPPKLKATDYGWEEEGAFLKPRTVSSGTKLAPDEVLEMVCCRCAASGCKGGNCKCSQIGCTIFCACEGGPSCMNSLTRKRCVDGEDGDGNWDDSDVDDADGSAHSDDV